MDDDLNLKSCVAFKLNCSWNGLELNGVAKLFLFVHWKICQLEYSPNLLS